MDPLFILFFVITTLLVLSIGAFLLLSATFVTITLSNIDPLDYYLDYEEEPKKK